MLSAHGAAGSELVSPVQSSYHHFGGKGPDRQTYFYYLDLPAAWEFLPDPKVMSVMQAYFRILDPLALQNDEWAEPGT